MKLRTLVVDDTSLFRRVIAEALGQLPNVEVIATAPNGKIALERVEALSPDLLTLDIEMPEMSGLEVLDALKRRGYLGNGASGRECGVVVVSGLTLKGGELTVRALESGAFDFVTKPSGGDPQTNISAMRDALAPIVNAYFRRWEIRSILKTNPARPAVVPPRPAQPSAAREDRLALAQTGRLADLPLSGRALEGTANLVVIGVSTGGPNALAQVLPGLPANFPAPVLVVQHMPPLFTQSLAASLAGKCSLPVKEAADGEVVRPGAIYIAPGGRQMKAVPGSAGEIILRVTDDPPENNCRPSVDYLFRSIANFFPGRAVGVIMTGMGSDGVLGLRLLKRGGSRVIAQDEASCIVYGMPGEAVKAGVVDRIVPLDRIAEEIRRSVKGAAL